MSRPSLRAAVSIASNAGGVRFENSQAIAVVSVKNNTGGTTVVNNCLIGSLTVTGNAAPVVDHPNQVSGTATLQ